MAFKKATKQNATIKLALTGPSGSGKTYSALLLAKGLGGSTALLDTEYGSASLYSDIFDFDTWNEQDPSGFPPEYYIQVIKSAEASGYNNLIIDSLSHEWIGRGGCLELADAIARTKYRGNSFAAWAEVTPRHNKLIEAIISSNLNIIATMRSKSEYVLNKDEKSGKTSPQKVGLGSIQRDGTDYEFTIIFELDRDSHLALAGKDRTSLFHDPLLISEATGQRISAWLSNSPLPAQPPATSPQPKHRQSLDNSNHQLTVDTSPTPAPKTTSSPSNPVAKPKRNARNYVVEDYETRFKNGEESKEILKDYAEILDLPAPLSFEKFDNDQLTTLARALYLRNNPEIIKPINEANLHEMAH